MESTFVARRRKAVAVLIEEDILADDLEGEECPILHAFIHLLSQYLIPAIVCHF